MCNRKVSEFSWIFLLNCLKKKSFNACLHVLELEFLSLSLIGRDLVGAKVNLLFFFLGEELAAFEVVVLQMLEDVQERLVYRAQVTV